MNDEISLAKLVAAAFKSLGDDTHAIDRLAAHGAFREVTDMLEEPTWRGGIERRREHILDAWSRYVRGSAAAGEVIDALDDDAWEAGRADLWKLHRQAFRGGP